MEQHGQSQRQHARQIYEHQRREDSGSGQTQHTAGAVEGFRQPSYAQQSAVSPEYGLQSSSQYGAGTPMQPSPMQYGQGVPVTEAARQQSQLYAQYGPNVMYGIGQSQGAQATQPSYEGVPQYRQRPGGGSETLAPQFGQPQYYLAGQGVPVSVAELGSQNIPSQYPPPDTYADAGSSALHTYPANVMDPSQTGTYNPYAQQPQYTPLAQISSDEQPFENYQVQIRNIFTLARDGALRDIGVRLLDISQYLLGNVEALGLTRDDETLHDGRIRLWDEFNRAWLVSLQRQLDLTQQAVHNNQPLEGNQSLMDVPLLERLSSELIRLCDNVEKHGLVDYQMGVAEEEIMELLLPCISLLNSANGRTTEGVGPSEASAAGASRSR